MGSKARSIYILMLLLMSSLGTMAQVIPDSVVANPMNRIALSQKLDSISSLRLPHEKYTQLTDSVIKALKIDSLTDNTLKQLSHLKHKLDSTLTNATSNIAGKVMPIGRRADSLQQNLVSKGKKITSLAEEKLNNLNKTAQLQKSINGKLKKAQGKAKLPVDIQNAEKLKGQSTKNLTDGLPDTKSLKEKLPSNLNSKLPTADVNGKLKGLTDQIPALDQIKGFSKAKELSNLPQTKADQLKGLSSEKDALSEKLNLSEIKTITDKTEGLKAISNEASKYKEDREIAFKNIFLNTYKEVFYSKLQLGQKNDLSKKTFKSVPGFQKIFF